jgi:Rhs element Vgr protein
MAQSPNDASEGVLRVSLTSNGQALPDTTQLISVHIDRAVNAIPVAKIVIADGEIATQAFPVSDGDDFAPGAKIKISAGYGDTETAIFEGVVVKHAVKITGENYSRLVVECRDAAVKMTIGRKNANYVDKKDSDIISSMIGSYGGLSADVEATTVEYKELVQYYCSDWDFMLSRAEVNGQLVIVTDGSVSVKAPNTSAAASLEVTYGGDLMEFHAEMDARWQYASAEAVSWDSSTQAVTVSTAAKPQTLNTQGNIDSAKLAEVVNLSSLCLQTAAPQTQDALSKWATAQQVKSGLARIRGRLKFQGSALAKVGTLLTLNGVGARYNGDVFVGAVHHELIDGNWITEVEFGLAPNWFAERTDIVAPPAGGFLPGVEGLQIGVVMKLDGDPEGHQRIQVSTPVMRPAKDGVWARLTKFYASDSFGAFFIPEVGDEVILGYLNNDPSHPVILGSLYSSKRKPPYEIAAENNLKAIVTRCKSKIEFNEEDKVITITTPGNNKLIFSDTDESILMQDQNSNKLELNTSGITMDSPKNIKINAQGTIDITAMGAISIGSQADVKATGLNVNCEGQVGFVGKGNATAELSASGQTTVSGAMVMIN